MEKKKKKGISIRIFNWIMIFIATIIASVLVVSLYLLNNEFNDVKESTTLYTDWKSGAMDVRMASDYLTEEVRSFVVTGKEEYINAYFNESKVTKRREI
jgi:CHASE3 domain sensor protein